MTWYQSQGVPEVGERFVADIVARIEVLTQHPTWAGLCPSLISFSFVN